jgi:catechol-2,3-dioxygenase
MVVSSDYIPVCYADTGCFCYTLRLLAPYLRIAFIDKIQEIAFMKIISLALQTNQPEKLRAFYTETMGLPLLAEEESQFSVQAGVSTITFSTVPDRADGPYHFAFNIPRNRIREAAEWLQERVAFLYAPGATTPIVQHENWEAEALYFYDPDFNIVELIAHKAAPESHAPFGSEQLIGLAEVGLPVTDVSGFARELREKLALPQWKTATALFEAVGNEEGMFIVVQEQRPWFPTQNPAMALPTRVEVQTAGTGTVQQGPFLIESVRSVSKV